MRKLEQVWGDPVWSKVIASAIVGAFGLATAYFAGWWPWLAAAAQWVGNFLLESTPLPNWLLGILGLCALLTAALLVMVLWTALAPTESRRPKFLDYTEDRILGLVWRWRYHAGGAIGHLGAYCPHCDLQVLPRNASAYLPIDRIEYWCEDCQCSLSTLDMSLDAVESLVRRKIRQKVRNIEAAESTAS